MTVPREQNAYWNSVAATKSFAHPLHADRLAAHVPPPALVLDCGCGYGRWLDALGVAGYRTVGIDPAAAMLARGRARSPDARLVHSAAGTLPFVDGAFDAALLLAVLTCIPDDDAQRTLVGEIRRVLRPGGVLYVSDLALNDDDRNRARYAAGRGRGWREGVFELDEGVVLRHHDDAWLGELFAAFDVLERNDFVAKTMNGHSSRAFQLFARRR